MTDDVVEHRRLIIAGTGIAGLTAAIYAARSNNDPLLVEGDEPGGQLTLTTDVENYPGFPEGISGPELINNMKAQATKFGAEARNGIIVDVSKEPAGHFRVELSDGDVYTADAFIAASGASARTLGVPGEDELMGYGLSTCATCDGAFHRGDDVLVVGGGDSAMEEATFLAKFADSVTVVHRRNDLRASEIMVERARDHDDVEFAWNTELLAIDGSQSAGVTGATLVSHPDGYPVDRYESDDEDVTVRDVDVGGVFYAIGHEPNTGFLRETPVELDDEGYVETLDPDEAWATTATAANGVFAAGDVMDTEYQQAVTAAGMGSMAALDAEEFLESTPDAAATTTAATAVSEADD